MFKAFTKLANNITVRPFFSILSIVAVAIVAGHKTLSFYFWHDDFSVFYSARIGRCIFPWPYGSYCGLFAFLEKLFTYNANLYFLLGFFWFVLSAVFLYLFVRKLLPTWVALTTALIYATGYIGAGTFLEAYDSNTSYLSLAMLFVSLYFFLSVGKSKRRLIFGFVAYFLSIIVLQARSLTYVFPAIAGVYFYREDKLVKKFWKFIIAALALLHITTYAAFFFFNRPESITSSSWGGVLGNPDFLLKIKQFFQTIGSLVLTDGILSSFLPKTSSQTIVEARLVLGISLAVLFLCYLSLQAKKKDTFRIGALALVWIIFLYLPFGIRSDVALWTTHRYLLFAYPGILLTWGLLGKYRIWYLLSIMIVFSNLVQVNKYLDPYKIAGDQRRSFYSQLHQELFSIPKGARVFFSYPPEITNTFSDFFRVGLLSSEASLAAFYRVNYQDFTLITDEKIAIRELGSYKGDVDRIYTFYFDGKKLLDTTSISRGLVVHKPKLEVTVINNAQNWNSKVGDVDFIVNKYSPIPSKMIVDMVARFPSLKVPYSQGCASNDCREIGSESIYYLGYLAKSNSLQNSIISISTTSNGESTTAENLVDDSDETYWIPNKLEWAQGNYPAINIAFGHKVDLGGFILKSDIKRNRPARLEVDANGKIISLRSEAIGNFERYVFDGSGIENLSIKILATGAGEPPIIRNISFIPIGLTNVDLTKALIVKNSPSGNVRGVGEKEALRNYLTAGADACIELGSGKNSRKADFRLFVDGKRRTYQIDIPAMTKDDFTPMVLGCTNYPVEFRIYSAKISY